MYDGGQRKQADKPTVLSAEGTFDTHPFCDDRCRSANPGYCTGQQSDCPLVIRHYLHCIQPNGSTEQSDKRQPERSETDGDCPKDGEQCPAQKQVIRISARLIDLSEYSKKCAYQECGSGEDYLFDKYIPSGKYC